MQHLALDPLVEANRVADPLDPTSGKERNGGATSKKRKFAGDIDEPKISKKRKNASKVEKVKTGAAKRGRLTKAKPMTSADAHAKAKASGQSGAVLNVELCSSLAPEGRDTETIEEVPVLEQMQEKSGAFKNQSQAGGQTNDMSKSETQNRFENPSTTISLATIGKLPDITRGVSKEGKTLDNVKPVKKRRKRRSIVQHPQRTQKRVSIESKKELALHPADRRQNASTQESLEKQPQLSEAVAPSSRPNSIELEKQASDPVQIIGDLPTSIACAKSKPRKKRKPIAQTSRPRKTSKRDNVTKAHETQNAPKEIDLVDAARLLPSATSRPSQLMDQPRKPLANVTNIAKGSRTMKPKEDSIASRVQAEDVRGKNNQDAFQLRHKTPNELLAASLSQALPSSKNQKPRSAKVKPALKPTVTAKPSTSKSVIKEAAPTDQNSEAGNHPLVSDEARTPSPAPSISPPQPDYVQALEPAAPSDSNRDQPPPAKKRGRPRKDPNSEPPATANHIQPPAKKAKASSSRRKPLTHNILTKQYPPIPSQIPGSDSDDPLSLDVPYPPKKARNPVDVPSQVSLEILQKHSDHPKTSEDETKTVEAHGEELKKQFKEMTGMLNRNEALRQKVAEVEKEERAMKKRLEDLGKEKKVVDRVRKSGKRKKEVAVES